MSKVLLGEQLARCANQLNNTERRVHVGNLGRYAVTTEVARALNEVVEILYRGMPTLAQGANHLILSNFTKHTDTHIRIQAAFRGGRIAQHGRKKSTKVPESQLQPKSLTHEGPLLNMPKGVSITQENDTLVIDISL